MAKLNYQHHYSSLQCHGILQRTKHFLLLSMLKTVVLLNIFVKIIYLKWKEFCYIIFTFTFLST